MGLISFVEDTEPTNIDDTLKWKEKPATLTKEKTKAEPVARKPAPPKDEGITSLSFDQVNDNADELIELRGAGRYFGVTDPSTGESINAQQEFGRICDNCHERGHVRAKCKTVICHKCGVVGDHYETQCPTTIVCSRCGERGHTWALCKSKTRKQQYCKTCDMYSHSDDNCPSIWRSYLTIACKPSTLLPASYCYNCGDDMHFGDECPEPRTSRIPNSSGSAFSGNNLPKELRDRYFNKCFGQKTKGFQELNSSRNFSSSGSYHSYGNSYGGNNSYGNGNYNNNSYNSNGYKNNGYGNNGYGNNGQGGNGGYSNNNNSNSKKRSFQSMQSPSSKNYEPSRSGFISFKTSGKKSTGSGKSHQASRSGVLPSKPKGAGSVKPSRSGVVSKGKKLGKKSMQQLY